MNRESLKINAKLVGLKLKVWMRLAVAGLGFLLIGYGGWSAFTTYQNAGGRLALGGEQYLPSLVAWDMIVIGIGVAIVLFISR